MNILLLGYGKMGQLIEKMALERNHHIIAKIGLENKHELSSLDPKSIDVAIEFSSPESAFENISYCLSNDIAVISGTTGWLDKKSEIEKLCLSKNGTFLYASNFSIGVNIFFKLNRYLAKIMNTLNEYNISIEEIHHTQKKDAPSGTAITIAEGIIDEMESKTGWSLGEGKDNEITINSIREGDVPGTHTVDYSSDIDSIEIRHTAHSRQGFALGAVMVAEWIRNKKGIFKMDDFLQI